jgi:hypothetical protein
MFALLERKRQNPAVRSILDLSRDAAIGLSSRRIPRGRLCFLQLCEATSPN